MEIISNALPEPLKAFVEAHVAAGRYSSASEYIAEPIRAAQKRQAEERVEALLLEGLDSGEPVEVSEAFWSEKRRRLLERHRKANGA